MDETRTGTPFIRTHTLPGTILAVLVTLACSSRPVLAQRLPARGWDVTAVTGYLGSRPTRTDIDEYGDEWYDTGQVGVTLGRYFSPHLKVEFDLSTSGEGTQLVQRTTRVPGYPYPIPYGVERQIRMSEFGTSLTWQFLDNQWVHPFAQIGAAADMERVTTRTWQQSIYIGSGRGGSDLTASEDAVQGPVRTTTVRAMVGGGAKWYVTPRVFLKPEARLAVGPRGQVIVVRFGVGVDW